MKSRLGEYEVVDHYFSPRCKSYDSFITRSRRNGRQYLLTKYNLQLLNVPKDLLISRIAFMVKNYKMFRCESVFFQQNLNAFSEITIANIGKNLLYFYVVEPLPMVTLADYALENTVDTEFMKEYMPNVMNTLSSLHSVKFPYLALSPFTIVLDNNKLWLRPPSLNPYNSPKSLFPPTPHVKDQQFRKVDEMRFYRAPEYKAVPPFIQSDTWSLATVVAEYTIYGHPMFYALTNTEQMEKTQMILGDAPKELNWPLPEEHGYCELPQILSRMLDWNPALRPPVCLRVSLQLMMFMNGETEPEDEGNWDDENIPYKDDQNESVSFYGDDIEYKQQPVQVKQDTQNDIGYSDYESSLVFEVPSPQKIQRNSTPASPMSSDVPRYSPYSSPKHLQNLEYSIDDVAHGKTTPNNSPNSSPKSRRRKSSPLKQQKEVSDSPFVITYSTKKTQSPTSAFSSDRRGKSPKHKSPKSPQSYAPSYKSSSPSYSVAYQQQKQQRQQRSSPPKSIHDMQSYHDDYAEESQIQQAISRENEKLAEEIARKKAESPDRPKPQYHDEYSNSDIPHKYQKVTSPSGQEFVYTYVPPSKKAFDDNSPHRESSIISNSNFSPHGYDNSYNQSFHTPPSHGVISPQVTSSSNRSSSRRRNAPVPGTPAYSSFSEEMLNFQSGVEELEQRQRRRNENQLDQIPSLAAQEEFLDIEHSLSRLQSQLRDLDVNLIGSCYGNRADHFIEKGQQLVESGMNGEHLPSKR